MNRTAKWNGEDIFKDVSVKIEEVMQDTKQSIRSSFRISKSAIDTLETISKRLTMNNEQVMDLFFGDGLLPLMAAQLPVDHYPNKYHTKKKVNLSMSKLTLAFIENVSSHHKISRDAIIQNGIFTLNERLITDDQSVKLLIEETLVSLRLVIEPLYIIAGKLLEIENPLLSSLRSKFIQPAQFSLFRALIELKGAIKEVNAEDN